LLEFEISSKVVNFSWRKGMKHSKETLALISQKLKGHFTSLETRDKIRQKRLGYKQTEAAKLKMSLSRKGRTAWNKGKPMSEVTKKKLSLTNKGKARKGDPKKWKHTEETKKYLKQIKLGTKDSLETKRKKSIAVSGSRNGFYGKHHSEETKRKLREINKNRNWTYVSTPEILQRIKTTKIKNGTYRLKHTGETKRKLREINKNRSFSPEKQKEIAKKLSKAAKGRLCSEEQKKKYSVARVKYLSTAKPKYSETDIEKIVLLQLQQNNVEFIKQYNVNNRFVADFYLPGTNTIIECDGCYWHGCPSCYPTKQRRTKDKGRDAYYVKCGYKLVKLWGHEIRNKGLNLMHHLAQVCNSQYSLSGSVI